MPEFGGYSSEDVGRAWWQQYQQLQADPESMYDWAGGYLGPGSESLGFGGYDPSGGDFYSDINTSFFENQDWYQDALYDYSDPHIGGEGSSGEWLYAGDEGYSPEHYNINQYTSGYDPGEHLKASSEGLNALMMMYGQGKNLLDLEIDPYKHYMIGETADISESIAGRTYIQEDVKDYLSRIGSSGGPVSRGSQDIQRLEKSYLNELRDIKLGEEEAYGNLFSEYGEDYYWELGNIAGSEYFDPFSEDVDYTDSMLQEDYEAFEDMWYGVSEGDFDMLGCIENQVSSLISQGGTLDPSTIYDANIYCAEEAGAVAP